MSDIVTCWVAHKTRSYLIGVMETTDRAVLPSPRLFSDLLGCVGCKPVTDIAPALAILALSSSLVDSSATRTLCRFAAVTLLVDLVCFYVFFMPSQMENLRSSSPVVIGAAGANLDSDSPVQGRSMFSRMLPGGYHPALLALAVVVFSTVHFMQEHILPVRADWTWAWIKGESCQAPESVACWLRCQSSQTLQDILAAIDPGITAIVFEAYAPLQVLVAIAEGTTSSQELTISGRLPLLVYLTAFLFVLWVAFTNLTRHIYDEEIQHDEKGNGDISVVRCLPQDHDLDIFILASCSSCFLVSVAYDRQIRLWDLDGENNTSQMIQSADDHPISWPVSLVAMDDQAEWLAVCSRDSTVVLWNCRLRCFGRSILPQTEGRIIACFFLRTQCQVTRRGGVKTNLILVLDTGALVDIDINGTDILTSRICDGRVRSPHISPTGRFAAPKIITQTVVGSILVSTKRLGRWTTEPLRVAIFDGRAPGESNNMYFSMVSSLKGLGLSYDRTRGYIHLLDMLSGLYHASSLGDLSCMYTIL
jgi:hypothetical protein